MLSRVRIDHLLCRLTGINGSVSQLRQRAGFFTLRALLYLLPGLSAAVGALVALLTAGSITPLLAWMTVSLIALGFAVPPAVDWIRGHYDEHTRQELLTAQRRQEWADTAAAQLRDHFGPRSRGILPSSVRSGSYFSGRVRVLTELAEWLGKADDTRARVVTGGPGSGKSAVLGRLLWLADPSRQREQERNGAAREQAETVPPAGVITVGVHARGSTVDEVAAAIAQALEIQGSGADGLIAALREGWEPRPAVMLIDAVDEAADPYRLIVELLEPLAAAAGRTKVRLLAGTRPGGDNDLLRLFGASAVIVDLDSPQNLDARDIEHYALRTLMAVRRSARCDALPGSSAGGGACSTCRRRQGRGELPRRATVRVVADGGGQTGQSEPHRDGPPRSRRPWRPRWSSTCEMSGQVGGGYGIC